MEYLLGERASRSGVYFLFISAKLMALYQCLY